MASVVQNQRVETTVPGTRSHFTVLCSIAVGFAVLHIATNNRYGFHRDELQFLSDARHLAWGYVAYPPFTPFVERIAFELFGLSLLGLRGLSVLAQAIVILVSGLMARDLHGGRLAQIVAGHNGNSAGIRNEESQYHSDIYVCGPPRKPWPEFWKHNQRFG